MENLTHAATAQGVTNSISLCNKHPVISTRRLQAQPKLTVLSVAPHILANDSEERPMPGRFQLVIDCTDPDLLARFWAAALRYEFAPPPAGFTTWNDFYRQVGVPEEELIDGVDRISDPEGHGPDIWFHVVPETKVVKNRLHFDIRATGGWTDPFAVRRQQVDAEAARLAGLGATITGVLGEGLDHYAVGMKDPEGNEFDIN
jgi:hypothetical protein